MANALPDLKLLRIFVSVVRHQGFANAQQELNLSTSAISTYMSQLEASLAPLQRTGERSFLMAEQFRRDQ